MLNDDDGVAAVDKFLQHFHQNADILKVEARRRLVEDIERLARIALGEFCSELHALALTTGKRGAALTKFDIT